MTEYLCSGVGFTQQAYYRGLRRVNDSRYEEESLLRIVREIRSKFPMLGTRKLWMMLNENGLCVGRDMLYRILSAHNMTLRQRRSPRRTTDSRHWMHQFPNLVKGLIVCRPMQVWVSDITYLRTDAGFVYLSLVTDAYSRRIMGWDVSPSLHVNGALCALRMALASVKGEKTHGLIHHSDRGSQYCSREYASLLKQYGIYISTTQDGSPYDNAVAERVNGILKREWFDTMRLENCQSAERSLRDIVSLYNSVRPHLAIGGLVPDTVFHDKTQAYAYKMY